MQNEFFFTRPAGEPSDFDAEERTTEKTPSRWQQKVASLGLVALLATGGGYTGARLGMPDSAQTGPLVAASPVGFSSDGPSQSLARVAAAVQPSVVSIIVRSQRSGGEGSGVILRHDGTIVTNNHVVESAAGGQATITVRFSDGKTAPATIVGRDPSSDIAVIKAEGVSGLTRATLGSTASLHVGDTVLALGSPLGLDGSVSAGIVSAMHRTVDLSGDSRQSPFGQRRVPIASVGDAIQTDAAVNPGNSGGPLVDVNGAVVGINTAIASTSGGSIGLGFAIPVEEVVSVANQLIDGETPRHALLGVQVDDDDAGALLAALTEGGAAEQAGLEPGDIVTKIDKTLIEDGTALAAVIRSHEPGDKVTVHYLRNGQAGTAEVTLEAAAP